MSYAKVVPKPAVSPSPIPTVSPSPALTRAVPSRTLIKRRPYRRAGDDAADQVPHLLLTAEEKLCDKMPRAFWDHRTDDSMPEQFALLDYSTVNRNKPVVVRHTLHAIDKASTPRAILEANYNLPWTKALFGPEDDRPGVFLSPFQRAMFHAQEKETHPDHYVELNFSFASDFLTHTALASRTHHAWNDKGEVAIKLPANKAFFDAFQGIATQESTYHCLVLYVKVKSVHSTLPMSMQICLQSRLPKSSALVARARAQREKQEKKKEIEQDDAEEEAESKTPEPVPQKSAQAVVSDEFPTHTPWSNVCGISSQNGAGFYTVPPLWSGVLDEIVYAADEAIINHPDFTRFIGTNWDKLREEFEQFREDALFYKMKGEAADQVVFTSFPFWFFICYCAVIRVITHRLNPKWIDEKYCMCIDKDPDDKTKIWVRIPVAAVEEIILRLERLYDQDALLMCFDELSLVIRPESGLKGWKEYEEWALNPRRGLLSGLENLAQFNVKLEVAYEPFKLDTTTKPLPNKYLPNAHLAMNSSAAPAAFGLTADRVETMEDLVKYTRSLNAGSAVQIPKEQLDAILAKAKR